MGMEVVLVIYIVVTLLSLVLKLCGKLRLGIPLIYIVLVCSVLREWADKNQTLAIGIFCALMTIVAVSWIVTIVHFIRNLFGGGSGDRAMKKLFACQLQQAQERGVPAENVRVRNVGGVLIVDYDD